MDRRFVIALALCVGVCFAAGGAGGAGGTDGQRDLTADDGVTTEMRRSLDDPADRSAGSGAPDPKLVPIALAMVGLLAAIGAATLIGTIVVRRRRKSEERSAGAPQPNGRSARE